MESLIPGAFKESVTLSSLWNIADNGHRSRALANGGEPKGMGISGEKCLTPNKEAWGRKARCVSVCARV